MKIFLKIRSLVQKTKLEAETAEEMRVHLEMLAERNRAVGMSGEDARYAALRQFGNLASLQQQARERRGFIRLEQLGQDVRFAFRQIARHRGFTAVIVLILALGIGACTSMFTVVDALLYRPLPVRDPARLRAVGFATTDGQRVYPNITSPCVREFREGVTALQDLIGSATVYAAARAGEHAVAPASGQMVTDNYFSALGVRSLLGRYFQPGEFERAETSAVAVISHECWQTMFDGALDVVGRPLQVNKRVLTVIGVAPPGFNGLEGIRAPLFWAPSSLDRSLDVYAIYRMAGRLRPGASESEARAQLDRVMAALAGKYGGTGMPGYEQYGDMPAGLRTRLVPAGFGRLGSMAMGEGRVPVEGIAALLGVMVGLVLLVACSNAASLLLVRALARRREIAVRLTLGATHGRILRQLLVESVLLSLVAALVGLLFARWGTAGLLALRPPAMNFMVIDAQVDLHALLFAVGTAMVTGIAFGLLPARQALRFDLHATLKQETPLASALHRRLPLRQWLLLAQVAIGTILLVGTGLCLRSLIELVRVDPGFKIQNVLTVTAAVDREKYSETAAQNFMTELVERIAHAPGVRQVAVGDHMSPLSGNVAWAGTDRIDGYAAKPGERIQFGWMGVGPGYFPLLGVQRVAGRDFSDADSLGTPKVVLVNQAFVRRYWPEQNPLGKSLMDGAVIGVVADIRSERLSEPAAPMCFTSVRQGGLTGFTLLIKTEADPAAIAPAVRRALTTLDPSIGPPQIETMKDAWSAALAPQRALLVLLAIFALIALVLAAVGLYGFVACSVAQRTREIGIRLAVGASRGNIFSLVLRQSMRLVLLGLSAGIALGVLGSRLMQGFLFGVSPADPLALLGVAVTLLAVTSLACWLPARRAAGVDPIVALRAE